MHSLQNWTNGTRKTVARVGWRGKEKRPDPLQNGLHQKDAHLPSSKLSSYLHALEVPAAQIEQDDSDFNPNI